MRGRVAPPRRAAEGFDGAVTAGLGAKLAPSQVKGLHVGRIGSLVVGGIEGCLVVVEVDLGWVHGAKSSADGARCGPSSLVGKMVPSPGYNRRQHIEVEDFIKQCGVDLFY